MADRTTGSSPTASGDRDGEQPKDRSSETLSNEKLLAATEAKKNKPEKKTFEVRSWKGWFQLLIARTQRADVPDLGAQLAYYFLLSLFPLLIFTFTLLPYLNLDQQKVFEFIQRYAPDQVFQLLKKTISEVLTNRNGGLLSFGILATIWSASNGVNALIRSLNRAYNREDTRPFWVSRGISIVFTLLFIVVVAVALVLPVFGEQIGRLLFSAFGLEEGFLTIWNLVRWAITPLVIFGVLVALYWVTPDLKLKLKSVLPGAAFAAIGWVVLSLGFSIYINNFGNYSKTYGSIGGIIILMLWLYLTGILLMIGGLINACWQQREEALETGDAQVTLDPCEGK